MNMTATTEHESLTDMMARADTGKKLVDILIADLVPDPDQDRQTFDQNKIDEIAASMEDRIERGLIPNVEPLQVMKNSSGLYTIFSGESRWRGATQISYNGKMTCLVRSNLSDDEYRDLMAISNSGRSDLNLVDKAEAIRRRVEDHNQPRKHVMAVFCITNAGYMSQILKFAKEATDPIKDLVRDGVMKDLNTLLDINMLDDETRQAQIEAARNNNLDRSLLKELKAEAKAESSAGTDKPKRVRKPTKMSLNAKQLRLIADGNGDLRKAFKEFVPGTGWKKLNDGDFVELFSKTIIHMEDHPAGLEESDELERAD